MTSQRAPARSRLVNALVLLASLVSLAILVGLGTWQVERLHWKEELVATIESRIHSAPLSLVEVQQRVAQKDDIEYLPVAVTGTFRHEGERHFFATHQGQSGYYVYTPMELDDGRLLFVNRGFVPFERKDPTTRAEGQVAGETTVTGLARSAPSEKASFIVPENEPAKNVFYWKDLPVMAETSGVGRPDQYLGFFVDAGDAPNPGGLPVGGVTIIEMPNNHLQYAVTWYGLALALCGVLVAWFWRSRVAA